VRDALLVHLVEDGAIAPEDADRVESRRAREGGSVDGLLLGMRLLPEARLQEALSRVSGLPAPPPAAFATPDPRARRVFPAKVAERHSVAPFALEGRELSVVTTYPPDRGLLDELGFLLSLHLRPHVAPEWRVRRLVQQLYGAPGAPRPDGPASVPATLAEADGRAGAGPGDAPAAAPPASAPETLRAPGWSPAEAREAVAAAAGPDEAIHAMLRAARDHFSFAAAFQVRRDGLAGHDALGHDPRAREACRRVAVDLSDAGLFAAPLETRAPYLGPPPGDAVTASILSAMGRVSPRTVLVAPVWLGERAACVLYADNDDEPVAAGRLADLFPLLGALGESLARMIRERKTSPAAPAQDGLPAHRAASASPDPASAGPAASDAPLRVPFAPPARPPAPSPAAVVVRAAPSDDWTVVEPAKMDAEPLRFAVEVDLGEYEVKPAAQALASGRADDIPSLVEALAASQRGSEDRRELLGRLASGGPEAAAALVDRLPGPSEEPFTLASEAPVESWGPIFAGVVAAGKAAEKPLLALLGDAEPERRRAAVALLSCLGPAGALKAIAELVQDEDDGVAAEAAFALAAARGSPAVGPTVAEIRRALASGRPVKATRAARALARIGDADAVPVLIQLLDGGGELARAASDALTAITMQRLGDDSMRWIAWWREWRAAPRASWLFLALSSEDPELRRRAAAELRRAGEPPEPFDPEAPEERRQRVAKAWAAWWREEGLAL
jgi:HEAT repeat protein